MRSIAVVLLAAVVASEASALPLQPKTLTPARWGNVRTVLDRMYSSSRTTLNHWSSIPRAGGRATTATAAACGDSDWQLALKAGVSTTIETLGLLAVLAGAQTAAKSLAIPVLSKVIGGLPVLQWASLFTVIFSSSSIKAVLDGGVSAASKQVLRPNVVPGDGPWYASLKKPWFNPPGWVFPIMWLIVSKPTQLYAVSRILQQQASTVAAAAKTTTAVWPALAVYCAHLSLGDTWNQVFFGSQRIRLGAGVIGTFWGVLIASAVLFRSIDPTAGLFLLPTIGWVTIASALNLEIYRLNKETSK